MGKDNVKKPFYKRWWFILLVVIVATGVIIPEGDSETDVVDYRVVEKADVSLGNVKRYDWHIVVNEQVNVEQLKEIAKQVVEKAKGDKDFNALSIGFYDYEEFIGHGYVLGSVKYAPEGDWSKAFTVEAGQYENMDFNYELREKDWSKQLTKEEAEIYGAWHKEKDFYPDLSETEISEKVGERFNLSGDEVYSIIWKHSTWMFDGD